MSLTLLGVGAAGGSSATYTHYRWSFTANGSDGSFTGSEELQLYESVGGSNVVNSYSRTVTASHDYSTFVDDNAADDDFGTRWVVQSPDTKWPITFEIEFTSAVTVVEYGVSGYGGSTTNRNFTDWTFEGSNDGATWTTLDTVSGWPWNTDPDGATIRFAL